MVNVSKTMNLAAPADTVWARINGFNSLVWMHCVMNTVVKPAYMLSVSALCRKHHIPSFGTLILTCFVLALSSSGSALATSVELTPAQTLMFDGNHLVNVPPNSVLNYNFVSKGVSESFTDTVQLVVGKADGNGGKDLDLKFLTGERRLPAATLSGFHNNATIMIFLQNDVRELEKQTGGSQVYFRNRIRDAFARPLVLQKTEIDFNGKKISSVEIIMSPFAKDPLGVKFRQFADRTYRFVMSEDIPGEVFQMTSTTRSPKGEIIAQAIMTFVSMEKKN